MFPQLPSRCLSSYPSSKDNDDNGNVSNEVAIEPVVPRPVFQLMAEGWVLFAELVQSTLQPGGREMVWARPLMLVCQDGGEQPIVLDLEGGSDLLWPAKHFSPAYAEDMLPFMTEMVPVSPDEAQQRLRTFVQRVWDVYEGQPKAG